MTTSTQENNSRESDTAKSTVKWFDAKKGYGFIDHPEGGDDVFVHYSQIVSDKEFKTLHTGQSVAFEMNDGPKGLHAASVEPLDEQHGDGSQNGSAERETESETSSAAAASQTQGDEVKLEAEPVVSAAAAPTSQASSAPESETGNRPA